jgi:hypothetical protein
MPPGDDSMLVSDGAAPAIDLPVAVGTAAAEPVAALAPLTDTGRTGLLAVIAVICVAGVTLGAIRAIVAERAYRAPVA